MLFNYATPLLNTLFVAVWTQTGKVLLEHSKTERNGWSQYEWSISALIGEVGVLGPPGRAQHTHGYLPITAVSGPSLQDTSAHCSSEVLIGRHHTEESLLRWGCSTRVRVCLTELPWAFGTAFWGPQAVLVGELSKCGRNLLRYCTDPRRLCGGISTIARTLRGYTQPFCCRHMTNTGDFCSIRRYGNCLFRSFSYLIRNWNTKVSLWCVSSYSWTHVCHWVLYQIPWFWKYWAILTSNSHDDVTCFLGTMMITLMWFFPQIFISLLIVYIFVDVIDFFAFNGWYTLWFHEWYTMLQFHLKKLKFIMK